MKAPSTDYREIALYNELCENCESPNTIVYQHPHKFAGMVICLDCENDDQRCSHLETRTDVLEVDTMRNGEHDTYERTAVICELCEIEVDDE